MLTSSDDGTSRLFAVPDGRLVAVMHGGSPKGLNSAAFSPDGRLMVTAGVDKTARVFAIPGGRPVTVLRGRADELEDAVFGPDSKHVATASADGTAVVWNRAHRKGYKRAPPRRRRVHGRVQSRWQLDRNRERGWDRPLWSKFRPSMYSGASMAR